MFVLCPHCQFLVGTDPRTGAPPPQCPKCGGPVQAPLPETPAPAAAMPLDPFATATLPSVAPPPADTPPESDSDAVPAAVEPVAPAAKPRKPRTRRNGAAARAAEQAAGTAQPSASVAEAADAGVVQAEAVGSAPVQDEAVAHTTIPEAAPAPAAMPAADAAPAPSFLHRTDRAATPVRRWPELAALVALALLLALQLLLAQRDALAAHARWRPLVAALCQALRCTLPPWREPAAFTMLHREVRPHPRHPGTLLVNASFRNDARWPQPWPQLLLTLSDLDGRAVGARAFTAPEYLGAPPAQREIAPGQSAAVTLVVVEPAPDVVAFSFDFR
ncbi:DUF3426 domain-containing protein [Vulcaniibacterium gelatinicum]|uniref:DUF3426 domain-containing protein n=1 Tax=Vulcaniibacterium gelatinicum TaxID=2598725 RepID=UPI0011C8ED5F|nr:DUF3426 domain-containing protein [Vulcaniibacterium gelatinicum]